MLIKLFILFGEVTSNNLVLHPRKKNLVQYTVAPFLHALLGQWKASHLIYGVSRTLVHVTMC